MPGYVRIMGRTLYRERKKAKKIGKATAKKPSVYTKEQAMKGKPKTWYSIRD